MGINFKKVGSIAARIVPKIFTSIAHVEVISSIIKELKGGDKKKLALELVKEALEASEDVASKDLLNDEEVLGAAEKIIDAIVALQNLIAKKVS